MRIKIWHGYGRATARIASFDAVAVFHSTPSLQQRSLRTPPQIIAGHALPDRQSSVRMLSVFAQQYYLLLRIATAILLATGLSRGLLNAAVTKQRTCED